MAEEVRDVRRTLPIAILASIILTMLLYVLVFLVAVLSMPIERLAESNTPIAALVGGAGSASAATGAYG